MPHWLQNLLFRRQTSARRRAGQVAVFLVMLLTALTFALLWQVDLHRIVTTKTRSQNAGDAAALAGSRWQGIGLNLQGELNLLHALALSAGNAAAVDAITNIQARILFTSPLMGLAAAQVAAKNNGMYVDDDFTRLLHEHAQEIRNTYTKPIGGIMLFPEPYPGAWDEYADSLDALAADGIAAGPDSTFFYGDSTGGHILKDKDFYEAVAGRTWCWFFLNHPTLLPSYTDYRWWPPLPPPSPPIVYNCEFLPLWLKPVSMRLDSRIDAPTLLAEAARAGVDMKGFTTNAMTGTETWYTYEGAWWGAWSAMATSGTDPFPATGPVRPEYNYAGADSAFRVHGSVSRLTAGLDGGSRTDAVLWTAAAKVFGTLGDDTSRTVPTRYGVVLPAFAETRLIPVDASYGGANGGFDVAWREHVDVHLPQYMISGPQNSGCWYCQQLVTWEDPSFRQQGISWLSTNSWRCTVSSGGGGGGGGGGRRRGH